MDTDPRSAGFCIDKLNRIKEHLMSSYVQPQKIAGCQILVSRNGIPAFWGSYGYMDIERKRVMRDDAIFRIYSMTKPITSVALMMLFEEGRFQLNDPVSKFIPSWKSQKVWLESIGTKVITRPPASPVTIRDIMTHTSGLTYGGLLEGLEHPVDKYYQDMGIARVAFRSLGDGETIRSFAEKMGQVPLAYDPGTSWFYSLSTDVCGCLVEIISGQKFEDFLQDRLFGPLDMKDTAFYVPVEKLGRFSACYERASDKTIILHDDPDQSDYRRPPSFPSGGGGLVGTISDYANFCKMLGQHGNFNGQQLIGRRTLGLMTQNHLGSKSLAQMAYGAFSETSNDGVGFGLGFASTIDEVASGVVGLGDFYWGGRASTIFWIDPNEDLFVIFMTQLIPSSTFNFRGQLKNIIYGALDEAS